jgi:chromosome segregation ATPase
MAEDGDAPGIDDTPDALREQLEAARSQIARLEAAASDADGLRTALDEANARVEAATGEASSLRAQVEEASERERTAAVRYRDLAMRAEPELPAEMIAGDSVDAIDASIVAAREVVTRVRSHIESQAQAARVPAGAPQRGERDLSGLSPQQKIRFGLEQRAQAS